MSPLRPGGSSVRAPNLCNGVYLPPVFVPAAGSALLRFQLLLFAWLNVRPTPFTLIFGLLLMTQLNSPLGASELHPDNGSSRSDDAPFTLQQYQWRSRVLVVSARDADDMKLMEQLAELASTSEEFADRDLVLVTLLDNADSMADRRKLTNAEVAAARAALAIRPGSFALRLIGKDGSVKLTAKSATSMKEIYALIDSMPMRQIEASKG